jgi:hypothetical protein
MTTKELVLRVLSDLPDDAPIEDVIGRLRSLAKLQRRRDSLESVEKFTQAEALERLRAADIAGPSFPDEPDDEDADLTDDEIEALEVENEAWFRAHPEPLGLSEAVLQDREGR